jgi:hypothetical protein
MVLSYIDPTHWTDIVLVVIAFCFSQLYLQCFTKNYSGEAAPHSRKPLVRAADAYQR